MIDFAGIIHSSTIDYPGKMCAVVYLSGCNFRCPFCHNRELVLDIEKWKKVEIKEIVDQLRENFLIEGVCLSIAEDEPVVIRNSAKLKHVKIKDLWDDNKKIFTEEYPIKHEYQILSDKECATLDGFKPATKILRHKTKQLYKIICSPGNYNIMLTGSHSIYVLNKDGIKSKKVSELNENDYLLSKKNVDCNDEKTVLDILDYLSEFKKNNTWIVTDDNIRSKFGKAISPRKISITKEFCEFLGYAVAEGSIDYNKKSYKFSLGDEQDLAKKILSFYRKIFKLNTGSIQKRLNSYGNHQYTVVLGTKPISNFIDRLVGHGFLNKHIPEVIFNTSKENRIAFLHALAEGDGHHRIRQDQTQEEFSIKTGSSQLASDIIFLAKTLDCFAWIEKDDKYFKVVISQNSLDKIGINHGLSKKYSFNTRVDGIPKDLLEYKLSGQKRHSLKKFKWDDLVNINVKKKATAIRYGFLNKEGDLSERGKRALFLRNLTREWEIKEIKTIEKITLENPKYVYDLVTENHSFVGGTGSLLLHNTGGEPLMQEDIVKLIASLRKNTPLNIKLDTNGSFPERLERVLPALSFISLDIKAPFEKYDKAIGVNSSYIITNLSKTLEIIRKCKFPKEARTTIVPGLNDSEEDIANIVKIVNEYKFDLYTLQQFKPKNTLDPNYMNILSPSLEQMRILGKLAKSLLPQTKVRIVTLEKGFEFII